MNLPTSIPSLKEIIFQVFGINLPIRGGMGDSIANAVIIERNDPMNDYVSVAYKVIDCIVKGREYKSWSLIRQQLIFENNKKYDKLEVTVVFAKEGKMFQQNENYFFDITECFGMPEESKSEEDIKLAQMKMFLDHLNDAIDKDASSPKE